MKGYSDLRAEKLQQVFIFPIEYGPVLVHGLGHADDLTLEVEDRCRQDRFGAKACLLIEGRVKTGILIGILDVDHLTGAGNIAG